jgi:hypothetical protein
MMIMILRTRVSVLKDFCRAADAARMGSLPLAALGRE